MHSLDVGRYARGFQHVYILQIAFDNSCELGRVN
jgi:hypothetical protein